MTHFNDLEPAQFLVENIELLPKGRVLDVAMGGGRNAIYLAKMGFVVVLLTRLSSASQGIRTIC